VANPDDVVPDLPALPPGSVLRNLEGGPRIFAPINEAVFPAPARGRRSYPDERCCRGGEACSGMFVLLSGGGLSTARCARAQFPSGSVEGGVNLSARWDSSREPILGGRPSPRPGGGTAAPPRAPGLAGGEGQLGERIPAPSPSAARFARARFAPGLIGPPTDSRMRRSRNSLSAAAIRTRASTGDRPAMPRGLVGRHAAVPDEPSSGVCPGGSVLKNPGAIALGGTLNVPAQLNPEPGYDVTGWGPAQLGLPPRSMGIGGPVGSRQSTSGLRGSGERQPHASRTYFACHRITGQELAGRRFPPARSSEPIRMPAVATAYPSSARSQGPPLSLVLKMADRSRRRVSSASGCALPSSSSGAGDFGAARSYWASPSRLGRCRGKDVVLVGGELRGTGSVFLSGHPAACCCSSGVRPCPRHVALLVTGSPPPPTSCPPLDELTALRGTTGGAGEGPVGKEPGHRTCENESKSVTSSSSWAPIRRPVAPGATFALDGRVS